MSADGVRHESWPSRIFPGLTAHAILELSDESNSSASPFLLNEELDYESRHTAGVDETGDLITAISSLTTLFC